MLELHSYAMGELNKSKFQYLTLLKQGDGSISALCKVQIKWFGASMGTGEGSETEPMRLYDNL